MNAKVTKKSTSKASASISLDDIKKLREKTFAGMALCKEALTKAGGDMEKAIEYVNQRSDVIGRLYNLTGAKIGQCKIAFEQCGKDFEKTVAFINEKGWAKEVSQEQKKAREGVIGVYLHGVNQKVVALVELLCDTDFVARNDDFKNLAHELAMQVASMGAKYADRDSVPADVIEGLKKEYEEDESLKNKPVDIVEKILQGKLEKFYQENCLLEQTYFRDETKKVRNLVDDAISKLGEKISVGRIYRMSVGE